MIPPASHLIASILSLATRVRRRMAFEVQLSLYRLLSFFGHEGYVPFIVLTRSRTGSNLLVSFLNGHSEVFCEGEIFATIRGRDPISQLESAFGRQPQRIKAKGFKIFYYHPLDAEGSALWHRLESMRNLRIIHLTRDNVLRTLLSRKIAGLQDKWTATRYDRIGAESRRVEFGIQELEDGFRQTREWERAAEERFREQAVLRLSYEQLVHDPQGTCSRVFAFLGVRDEPPVTSLKKQNPESLSNLISNYGVLKDAFGGSEWASYFDE